MKKYFVLLLFSGFMMTSCGDDDPKDCTAAQFNSEVNATITALNTAAQTWANDPTSENCNKYKDAANDYLDAVESFDGCAGLNQADFESALNQARDAVAAIAC